jgi:hypothetical protein
MTENNRYSWCIFVNCIKIMVFPEMDHLIPIIKLYIKKYHWEVKDQNPSANAFAQVAKKVKCFRNHKVLYPLKYIYESF